MRTLEQFDKVLPLLTAEGHVRTWQVQLKVATYDTGILGITQHFHLIGPRWILFQRLAVVDAQVAHQKRTLICTGKFRIKVQNSGSGWSARAKETVKDLQSIIL